MHFSPQLPVVRRPVGAAAMLFSANSQYRLGIGPIGSDFAGLVVIAAAIPLAFRRFSEGEAC